MLASPVPKDSTSPRRRDQEDPSAEDPSKTSLGLLLNDGRSLSAIAVPMVLTGLLIYARSAISMLFLDRLGDLALAGGSLAIGFANITGYSVLSGLATSMEPICGQAYGAGRYKVLGLTMQRTILLLLLTSIPISVLWLNMKPILLYFGQQDDISSQAQLYILYSLPDLAVQSLLHPLRIYLRSQSITMPLTFCAAQAIILHVLINYLLVNVLGLGIKGVVMAAVLTNINLVASLILYILISSMHEKTWDGFSSECLKGFKSLVDLAVPSCISVCLEWWWYEIMILLCGYLLNALELVAQINEGLDSLAQDLRQLINERESSIGLANNSRAPCILLIYTAIKTIWQRFMFGMGRQDDDLNFRLAFASIAVALGCVECGLLMSVLLSGSPWPISVACILMLVIPFMFITS